MIAFLPKLYEDELLSSYLMRVYSRSAFIYPKHFLNEILDGKQRFNYLYVNRYKNDFFDLLDKQFGFESIINNHTLYGFDSLFGNYNGASPTKGHLRYCSLCMKEMEERHIQLLPQIRGLHYCPIHRCEYLDSNICLDRSSNYLIRPINEFIVEDDIPIKQVNSGDINVKLAQYVMDVLNTSKNVCNQVPIHKYLREHLPMEFFLSKTRSKINITKVKNALDEFYKDLEEYSLSTKQIRRTFTGESINSYHILLVAFWMDIKPSDLINRNLVRRSNLEKRILKLKSSGYSERQIASKVNLSKTKIHNILRKDDLQEKESKIKNKEQRGYKTPI